MKNRFVSNVSVGTGSNYMLECGEGFHIKTRAYFRVQDFGNYNWKFYFQNTVDSTFAFGDTAYRNKSGGEWKIISAHIGYTDFTDNVNPESEIKGITKVTFDGCESKDVKPDERFWSDEIEFALPNYKYLVWEWEIIGNKIPCTPDSQVPTYMMSSTENSWNNVYGVKNPTSDKWSFIYECPLPDMIACDRKVNDMTAFIGDSITQGCGTNVNRYEMWVSKIAERMGKDYSVWNLGLGYGRASDCKDSDAWKQKAKMADRVVITLGVNDLLTGKYHPESEADLRHGATCEEIQSDIGSIIEELKEAGCEVILSTTPPFDFPNDALIEWRKLNMGVERMAEKYGLKVYDIERSLDADKNLGNIWTYGPHPNDAGGTAAADCFKETFYRDGKWF